MHMHPHHHAGAAEPRLRAAGVTRPHGETGTADDRSRAHTYRRFLRRTQDVSAVARTYPGGLATLIRDREVVTNLLIVLLQRTTDD